MAIGATPTAVEDWVDSTPDPGDWVDSSSIKKGNTPTPKKGKIARFASGVASTLLPSTNAADYAAPFTSLTPWKNLALVPEAMYEAGKEQARKSGESLKAGNYSEALGHGAAALLPGFGPAAANAGESIGQGDIAGGLGQAAGLLAPFAASKAMPLVKKGLRTVAESAAESSLGVTNRGRAFSKTPGAAVLDETSGLKPSTVMESAHKSMNDIGSQLQKSYRDAGTQGKTASLQPAIDILDKEIAKATTGQNPNLVDALQRQKNNLTVDLTNNQPLPADIPPERMWSIKQNWGGDTNWNANVDHGIRTRIDRAIYRAMDDQLDRSAPGTDSLNQRYSSLKEVKRRADITSRSEDLPASILSRVGKRTGGAAVGMYELLHGNVPAGLAALIAPELLSNPAVPMGAARLLNKASRARLNPLLAPGSAAISGMRDNPFSPEGDIQ